MLNIAGNAFSRFYIETGWLNANYYCDTELIFKTVAFQERNFHNHALTASATYSYYINGTLLIGFRKALYNYQHRGP